MIRSDKRGFTIVEMLMVIGILAVLMGIVTTASTAAIRAARERRTDAVKQIIQNGIATYRSRYDCWPEEGGQLEKWASGSDTIAATENNVPSGPKLGFLKADDYDKMMAELAKVSVGKSGASPVLDIMGINVARKAAADSGKGRGMEFSEAIKKNKKHGATYSLKEMVFGYLDKETGYFRRFIVQYNVDTDSVVVMTRADFESWWEAFKKNGNSGGQSLKWPTGYEK